MINRVTSHPLPQGTMQVTKPGAVQPLAEHVVAPGSRRKLKGWFMGVAVLFGILVVGCSQGTYPVDIFYEQHYQQSYRSHEPPRLIGSADAVAFFPPPPSTVTNTGADLYRVNCQMCHGVDAKGTGPVLAKITDSYGYQPIVDTNITTRPVALIDGTLTRTSRPFGPDSVMPPFGKLLTGVERSAIAQYVGSLPK